jgi:hypothetical protein
MIGAQIGDGSDVGVLALLVRLVYDIFVFFGDVADTRLVLLTVRVNHWGSVTSTRVAFSLHVTFLLTVAAHNIGIARAVAADRGGVGGGGTSPSGVEVVVARRLLTMDSRDLFYFFVGQLVPENGIGLTRLHRQFNRSNFLRPFAVILNGLDLPGELHTLLERSFASLENLVAHGVLNSGQEKLMLEEEGHVVDALGLGLVDGGTGEADSSQCGGLVVYEAVIGNLYSAVVVVH